jgi:hypothetical protein
MLYTESSCTNILYLTSFTTDNTYGRSSVFDD